MGLVGQLNFQGLLTCAIIVAGLGVLNDVTITQSSAVWELRAAAPELSRRGLFGSVMRIGRDHIASTIYTIVFAYAGAAVSVLLVLFLRAADSGPARHRGHRRRGRSHPSPALLGLVLAVPITAIATLTVSGAMSEEQHPDSPYQRPDASPHDRRSAKRAQGAVVTHADPGLRHTVAMLHLRITAPSDLTERVLQVFADDPAVSNLAVLREASLRPPGDVVLADVAREAANEIIDQLTTLGLPKVGTVHVEPVTTWISEAGLAAEQRTPGSSADSVIWADVTQRAYQESELNWTYLSFMTLATLLAGIAIVVDSQILVIGAMVLGPEFVAIAALGLSLVRRRPALGLFAARTLLLGFAIAIGITTLAALAGRALGWITIKDVTGPRPGTDFIYSPDKWSFIVAVIAAAAGVLSLTSAKLGGLSGVFISVTTVPAAGNVALGIAFGASPEIWGSTLQLLLNLTGMAVAGWATLAFQQAVWSRMSARRARLLRRRTSGPNPL